MRFDDIMRYVPVNEDWENRSDEDRRERYLSDLDRGIRHNRREKQARFDVDRATGTGGEFESRYEGSRERQYRESHIGEYKGIKDELKSIYERSLKSAKTDLLDLHEKLRTMKRDNFGYDMSGVGRKVGSQMYYLLPAIEKICNGISSLEQHL